LNYKKDLERRYERIDSAGLLLHWVHWLKMKMASHKYYCALELMALFLQKNASAAAALKKGNAGGRTTFNGQTFGLSENIFFFNN
jgi:hypothetical protein